MYNRAKVFSATKFRERDELGEKVTEWIRQHPNTEIVDAAVRQSSDREFHCLSIVLFCKEDYTNDKKAT